MLGKPNPAYPFGHGSRQLVLKDVAHRDFSDGDKRLLLNGNLIVIQPITGHIISILFVRYCGKREGERNRERNRERKEMIY